MVYLERKACKGNLCKSKVERPKKEDPKRWWKRLCGAQSHSCNLWNSIQIDELNDLEEFRLPHPLVQLPCEVLPVLPEMPECRILAMLSKLNPTKASGPDEIPKWLRKVFAELLACTVSKIINALLNEQRLPRMWKLANVTPLPYKKQVEDVKKDL